MKSLGFLTSGVKSVQPLFNTLLFPGQEYHEQGAESSHCLSISAIFG